jgi:hypothetical protein
MVNGHQAAMSAALSKEVQRLNTSAEGGESCALEGVHIPYEVHTPPSDSRVQFASDGGRMIGTPCRMHTMQWLTFS